MTKKFMHRIPNFFSKKTAFFYAIKPKIVIYSPRTQKGPIPEETGKGRKRAKKGVFMAPPEKPEKGPKKAKKMVPPVCHLYV